MTHVNKSYSRMPEELEWIWSVKSKVRSGERLDWVRCRMARRGMVWLHSGWRGHVTGLGKGLGYGEMYVS